MDQIELKENIRADFPALNKKILKNDLIYFDTAASAQKHSIVINELSDFTQVIIPMLVEVYIHCVLRQLLNMKMQEKKFKNF